MMRKCILSLLAFLTASVVWAESLPTILVTYNETSATVSIPDEASQYVTATIDGAHVSLISNSISQEYCYKLSGQTSDGSFTLIGSYKLTLELAGVNINNTSGAAIDIECGKRIAVIVDEGTTNTLSDAEGGLHKGAMYFAGHPEFEGMGTLNVTGRTKHAIAAKEYLEIKRRMGTINVLGAVNDGVHCGKGKMNNENNYFEMKGGVLNISGTGSDGIHSDDYGCMRIEGGTLNVAVSATGGSGLKCDSIFTMTGGEVNITLTGDDAEGIRCNHTAYFQNGNININNSGAGSKGIKLKCDTLGTVINGGYAHFEGTSIDIMLSGNNYKDGSRCMGVSVDKDLALNDGDIVISPLGNQVKAYNVKGTLNVTNEGRIIFRGPHNLMDVGNFEYDMTAYVCLCRDGEPVNDYANYQIRAVGETSVCCGVADVYMVAGGITYGYLRLYGGTNGTTIGFQVTDAGESRTYIANETISFSSNGHSGTPSNPFVLNIAEPDKTPTIGNLARLISRLLRGSETDHLEDVQKMAIKIATQE